MRNQYFRAVCAITCLFAMSHVVCYAEIKVADENKSIHQLSSLDKEMMELYQFDHKYEEFRNLFLEKNIYFEDIKDYFFSNGSIKSFGFHAESESVSYAGQINEVDYIRLKKNARSIYSEKDNFSMGIGANFVGSTLEKNNKSKTILFLKRDGIRRKRNYICFECLSYEEDSSDIRSNRGGNGWYKKKEINPQWYFSQSIQEIKLRYDDLPEGSEEKEVASNEEHIDKALSYEKIKKVIVTHRNEFEIFVNLLRGIRKKEFSYANYMDFTRSDDEQVYKNFNMVFYENAGQTDVSTKPSQQECNSVFYYKETEKFIAFLKENNIVLPVGVSIETSFSEDGAFQLKIFTRSQLVNDKCFNVAIIYNSADKQIKTEPTVEENMPTWLSELITPKKPLEQEIIPHWYYIEEIGRKSGLYQGK